MALSAEESALLTETCANMNVAANTCREVLEMLRSLGNTGVVDIATHNNAATPHGSATNLVHIDNNRAHLGSPSEITPVWSGKWPFEIYKGAFSNYIIRQYGHSKGTTQYLGNAIVTEFALTDSNSELLSNTGAANAGYPSAVSMFGLSATCKTYDQTANILLHFMAGDTSGSGTYAQSSAVLWLQDGSTYTQFYELNTKAFMPARNNVTVSLGLSDKKFDTAYLSSATVVGSDRRSKTNIDALDDKAVSFVNALHPVSYKLAVGKTEILETDQNGDPVRVEEHPGARTHWGFIAQEVKEAMTQAGIEDAAAWTLADKDDPDSMQSLRYEELIAPLVKAVQVLAAKVEALEGK